MKRIWLAILTLLAAAPVYGQGLVIVMRETGPVGQTTPMLQATRTHARLDIPSMASQVLYDAGAMTLRLVVPLLKSYREFTPAIIKELAATNKGQAAPVAITYKRTGSSKVRDWACTTYDGFRGAEKVVEVCAAEGAAISVTRQDFVLVQQAIDMAKSIAPAEMIERIPLYGSAENQGFAGFPVRRVSFRSGKAESTTELAEIRREAVPEVNFAVPAGFTKAQ